MESRIKAQKPVKVYLFGGEGTGWALDADVHTTRQSLNALEGQVVLTPLEKADVVHSVWEYPLLHMDPNLLDGKRIVCHVCNDLMRTYEDPSMTAVGETLGLWVAISKKAQKELKRLGHHTTYIPYTVDTTLFTIKPSEESVTKLRQKFRVPKSKFIISNFMRDSSAVNLEMPKEQKGVEAFLTVVCALYKDNLPIHILLAGPRRHWLKKRLAANHIPYTYIGEEIEADDNHINILSPEIINELYHISDLHLITSRWEGGPRSVLEAAATLTPIFCTPVGMAADILEPECLIDSIDDAIKKTKNLIINRKTSYPAKKHFQRITESYTPSSNISRLRTLYENINEVPIFYKKNARWDRSKKQYVPMQRSIVSRFLSTTKTIFSKRKREKDLTIGVWHEFHKPPYGGGNQFMLALKKEIEKQGINVVVNRMSPDVDVHICNSAWFDVKKFVAKSKSYPIRMIHRIDGPTTLYRGQGREEDDKIFDLNRRFGSATVFQSAYSFYKSCELGYSPVNPLIIHNAVDGSIFHGDTDKIEKKTKSKISLISTSWSDNPRKGGAFYKWLDDNLDFDRFGYTFVGRVNQEFQNIKLLNPVASKPLAEILRKHDIFITASQHEPCSNALLEALACGLPTIYRNDGGNAEFVSFGGLPFDNEKDFMIKLERIVACYNSFKASINIKSIEIIANRYIELARQIVNYYNPAC